MEVITCERDFVMVPMREGNTLTLMRGDRLTISGIPTGTSNKKRVIAVNEHTVSPFIVTEKTIKRLMEAPNALVQKR